MPFKLTRCILVVGTCIALGAVSSVGYGQSPDANGFLSANAIAQSYFQRRLLEFVAPVYQQPLISAGLIESLSRPGPNATEGQIVAAEKIAFAGASATQIEMQSRMLELALRQQTMQAQGMTVGGVRSTIQAGGLSAKSLVLQNKVQALKDQLAVEREKNNFQLAVRKEQLEYRLEKIKRQPNTGLNARSGFMINVVLDAIKPTILEFGFGVGQAAGIRDEIQKLTLETADIAKIQLQLDVEGPPVIFTADKGSVQLGQLPFLMNHAELIQIVRKIESTIEELSRLKAGPEFFAKTTELSSTVENLEAASDRLLGTAKENAQRGSSDYRLWRIAKDYRSRMRGIVSRLQLEGSPKFLTTTAKKYDTALNGNSVFSFARFVAENNCKIAPAAQGDEATYVRFLSLVQQLEAILNH